LPNLGAIIFEIFPSFGEYLNQLGLKVPRLVAVLQFERAGLATLVDGQARVVPFEFEPLPLLRALAEGRLPDEPGQTGSGSSTR